MAYKFSDTKRVFNGKEYHAYNLFRTKAEATHSADNLKKSGYFTRITAVPREILIKGGFINKGLHITRSQVGFKYVVWLRWNKLPAKR